MRYPPTLLVLAAALAAANCGGSDLTGGDLGSGSGPGKVLAINASSVPVTLTIDGTAMVSGLPVAGVSGAFSLESGPHTVAYQATTGGKIVATTISVAPGQQLATFVFSPSAASLGVDVIADTGAIVPANKSKLRVANLAPGAGSDTIWRTQPDYQTPITIQTPFPYQTTSPYLQSDPGTWEVFVTSPAGVKLATTGAVTIPAGERRTAVLMDSAGTLVFKVFE